MREELTALYKLVPDYDTHGWVWFFERQAIEKR